MSAHQTTDQPDPWGPAPEDPWEHAEWLFRTGWASARRCDPQGTTADARGVRHLERGQEWTAADARLQRAQERQQVIARAARQRRAAADGRRADRAGVIDQ